MANTNTDLTEEDAADLQFPKGTSIQPFSAVSEMLSRVYTVSDLQLVSYKKDSLAVSDKSVVLGYCSNCFKELVTRYIFCDMCKINICLQCFANGAEFGEHKNDHNYRVHSTNFVLFENSDWTAEEELKLIDLLLFYGNWGLVALNFPNRTINEIKEHYEYFYLDGHGSKNIPVFKKEIVVPEITVPYRFQLTECEEPPRYACNTVGYQSLAGYNPPRGDFENEYDKNAEDLVASLEPIKPENPYFEILTNLQYAITQNYNNRLRERNRRKTIIAQHGLLVLRKTLSWLHRYDGTITKPVCEKMLRFMHLCEPTKFEMLMEGMHRAGELRVKIER